MLSYEANERIFLFRIEVSPNPSSLAPVIGDKDQLLGLGRRSGGLHCGDLQLLQWYLL